MVESRQLPKVAILGANGQVGTELCFHLEAMGFCEPVAVMRSRNSAALLMRGGITCRFGDVGERDVARSLLEDCDLVFDLALPAGRNYAETRTVLQGRTAAIFDAMRPATAFILASTTSVYRYSASLPLFRNYRATKMLAEKLARKHGGRRGVPVYIFRLGQVHGVLQSCSLGLEDALSGPHSTVCVPDQKSNAVFVVSIAEAVRDVLAKAVAPDTYTVVSAPEWSFADLAARYSKRVGKNAPIVRESVGADSTVKRWLRATVQWMAAGASALVKHNREFLSAAVSMVSSDLEQRLRFSHVRKMVAASVAAHGSGTHLHPFEPLRPVPGKRFPFTSASPSDIDLDEAAVRRLIDRAKA